MLLLSSSGVCPHLELRQGFTNSHKEIPLQRPLLLFLVLMTENNDSKYYCFGLHHYRPSCNGLSPRRARAWLGVSVGNTVLAWKRGPSRCAPTKLQSCGVHSTSSQRGAADTMPLSFTSPLTALLFTASLSEIKAEREWQGLQLMLFCVKCW